MTEKTMLLLCLIRHEIDHPWFVVGNITANPTSPCAAEFPNLELLV